MANLHRYVYLYAVKICHINTLFSHGYVRVCRFNEGKNIYTFDCEHLTGGEKNSKGN